MSTMTKARPGVTELESGSDENVLDSNESSFEQQDDQAEDFVDLTSNPFDQAR